MREHEIKPSLLKILFKLSKKDKPAYEAVMDKIKEIVNCDDIHHYKNLRYDMKTLQRVHIGHFVLVFAYDESRDFITFADYDHHDNIYQR